MHPKLHHFLYAFFIQGLDLDRIAAIYESSWHEVTKVLDSEPARELMRSALRIERLRAAAENLAGRRTALRTLGAITNSLDSTSSGLQSRRRAATAILSGTKPGRSNKPPRAAASPKPTSPLPPPPAPQPEKQPAPRKPTPTPTPSHLHKPLNTPNQISPRKPANNSGPKPAHTPTPKPAAKPVPKPPARPTTKTTTKPTHTPTRSARSATLPTRPTRETPSNSSTTRRARQPTRKPHHQENSS